MSTADRLAGALYALRCLTAVVLRSVHLLIKEKS